MHYRSILVIGAGLMWVNGPGSMVVVDRESAAVCKRAAELAEEYPDVYIYITAGESPEFGVIMNVVMAECLKRLGVHTDRIVLNYPAKTFNTRGEVEAFAARRVGLNPERDTHDIFVVDRDFHMSRTCLLLDAQLGCYTRRVTTIKRVPIKSNERMKNLIREPAALIKDGPYILSRRFRRWRRYYIG